ncbi:60S ribosomal export protein NMD3 [Candidatus Micrarchaeota archaeon]|nr:60S ribosomal export protein NMD3 [Candidatus Micrarchaeota archaeon]MBU1930290.1 60S ribosomal export protein NMD3 [Candidatus Micrarchaeota archaeon]
MKKRFCPKCGATNKPFIQGFCKDCFLETHSLIELPQTVEIEQCKKCEKLLVNGKWFPFSVERIVDWVREKIKTKELENKRFEVNAQPNEEKVLITGKVLGELNDELLEFPIGIEVKIKQVLCHNCSILSANYYESRLQVRFESLSKPKWKHVLTIIRETMVELFHRDSLAQITNIEKLKNGFDVYIGSKRAGKMAAERIAHKFGGEITRSFSLAGIDKSGKTKKKFTFLVRI